MKFTILSITLCLLISLFGVHGKSTGQGMGEVIFGGLGVKREYGHNDDARSNSFMPVGRAAADYANSASVTFDEDVFELPSDKAWGARDY
eukprot:CFRG8377T1